MFWRVHRSFLVNINKIKEVVPWFKSSYQLRMDDKKHTEIPVSRVQTKRLRGTAEAVTATATGRDRKFHGRRGNFRDMEEPYGDGHALQLLQPRCGTGGAGHSLLVGIRRHSLGRGWAFGDPRLWNFG